MCSAIRKSSPVANGDEEIGHENEKGLDNSIKMNHGESCSKWISIFALVVALTSLVLTMLKTSLVPSSTSINASQPFVLEVQDDGEQHVKDWVTSVFNEEDRKLFSAPSLGCESIAGYTRCMDSTYISYGVLEVDSGCLAYSAFSSYLRETVVPGIVDDHVDWGVDFWTYAGYKAVCGAEVMDYELYDLDGSGSCVYSAKWAVATQLFCIVETGLSGGGGGGGGYVPSVPTPSGCPMCIPQMLCENRVAMAGGSSSSCDYCEPGECD